MLALGLLLFTSVPLRCLLFWFRTQDAPPLRRAVHDVVHKLIVPGELSADISDRGIVLVGVGLLQPDGIATADLASLQHRGIDPDISPVVLGC